MPVVAKFSAILHTGLGVKPASCTMGNRSISRGKAVVMWPRPAPRTGLRLRLCYFGPCWRVNFNLICLLEADNVCTAVEWLLSYSTSQYTQYTSCCCTAISLQLITELQHLTIRSVYVLMLYSHLSATHYWATAPHNTLSYTSCCCTAISLQIICRPHRKFRGN